MVVLLAVIQAKCLEDQIMVEDLREEIRTMYLSRSAHLVRATKLHYWKAVRYLIHTYTPHIQ